MLIHSKVVYERLIHAMRDILDRLFTFIQPAAEQWDEHQGRLERVMVQLLEMMRECRRPHDIQNEVENLLKKKRSHRFVLSRKN